MDIKLAALSLALIVSLLACLGVDETTSSPAPKKSDGPDYHYHKESHKHKHKNRHKHRHGHRKKKHRRSGGSLEKLTAAAVAAVAANRRDSLAKLAKLGGFLRGTEASGDGGVSGQRRQLAYTPPKTGIVARQSSRPNSNSGTTSLGDTSLAADFNAPDMQFPREETGGEFAANSGLGPEGPDGPEPGFERSNDRNEFATGFGDDYQLNFEEYSGPYTASGDVYRYEGYKKK